MNAKFVQDQVENLERLNALRETGLLDSPPETCFDRLIRLATKVLKTPIALLSLVDHHRQFFKSFLGLPEEIGRCRETPLSHSFCKHVVASKAPLIVNDAHDHAVVAGNLAIRDIGVTAYIGVPLLSAGGFVIGSFCGIDTVPRVWTDEDLANLTDLAAAAMSEFSHRAELSMRRKTEIALRTSDQRLRSVLDSAEIATWEFNVNTGKLISSSCLGPLFGLAGSSSPEGIKEWFRRVDLDDSRTFADDLLRLVARKLDRSTSLAPDLPLDPPLCRKVKVDDLDGSTRWIKVNGKLYRDPLGRPESVVGLCGEVVVPRENRVSPTQECETAGPRGQSLDPRADPKLRDLVREYERCMRGRAESIREAVESNDYATAELLAHQTKGVSAMFGYPKIGSVAARLDQSIRERHDSSVIGPLVEEFARTVTECLPEEDLAVSTATTSIA